MDQLHTANKVCGGCCAISLNTVDTESSVSPIYVCPIIFQTLHVVNSVTSMDCRCVVHPMGTESPRIS